MPLFHVRHTADNGGDFKWLHTHHIIEASDEADAKAKSLAAVDAAHKYNDNTRPRFITAVSPAAVGEVPTVPTQAEPDDDDVKESE